MARSRIESHRQRGFELKVNRADVMHLIYQGLKNGCAYCGCELEMGEHVDGQAPPDNMITLEVIDPTRRVLDETNIKMVCDRCNRIKGSMNLDDFYWQCRLIADNLEGMMMGGK